MEYKYTGLQAEKSSLTAVGNQSIETLMRSVAEARCREILWVDLTADTFRELPACAGSAQDGIQVQQLSARFAFFADGPLCHDNDRERFRAFTEPAALRQALERESEGSVSLVYRRKFDPSEAVYRTVSMELYPAKSEDGHLTAVLAVRDITTEIQQYDAGLEEDAKRRSHISGKRTILIVEDNEMNRELLAEILADDYQTLEAENGAVGLELLQKHMLEISVVILDVQMPVMNGYDFLRHAQSDPFLAKIPVVVATGSDSREEERICLGLGASDFVGKPYNPDIIRSRIANIIRLKESTATMTMLQMDERTGLFTLQAFYYHVKQTLDRDPDGAFSVMVFDADHFKQVCESQGDKAGSELLRQIAGVLQAYTAGSDIYGRFGAARFLLLRSAMSTEETEAWARELLSALKSACPVRGLAFRAGIYSNVDKSLSVPMICDRAITALNSVGQNFDKPYALYDEKHAEQERRLAAMEADMRTAYEQDQFSVYYQPKHDAQTGKLLGAEALIRWIHPTYGFMSPGEFIPLFEKNGFVSYADYYVLKRTCCNLRSWMDEGITPVPVSVNSSRRDFAHENYLQTVCGPLRENAIDPSLIHIEVTESMFSDSLDEISRVLRDCREAGFRIELDDFGSGYSSLTTLTILPLDVMKLDMSFMRNYRDEKKRKVLATCIALAKSLGLKTVCEGVEYADQLDLLREYGCDMIQGYYFSRPLPEKDFREYLIRYQN